MGKQVVSHGKRCDNTPSMHQWAIIFCIERLEMMKYTALAALLSASASAFAPIQQSARSTVSLNAERSKSLPFMNAPALVSLLLCRTRAKHLLYLACWNIIFVECNNRELVPEVSAVGMGVSGRLYPVL
jgi:hypothetical protein